MELAEDSATSETTPPDTAAQGPIVVGSYAGAAAGAALVGAALLAGVVYVVAQWSLLAAVPDGWFVVLLVLALAILLFSINRMGRYIETRGLAFCRYVYARESPNRGYAQYVSMCRHVFNSKGMTVTGVLYGLAVAAAPWILDVWAGEPLLRLLLALFLFTVNFGSGIALYGLFVFFYYALKLEPRIEVELWRINNPATDFFINATRRLAVYGAVYVAISMSSIAFSEFPFGPLVVGYIAMACTALLLTIVIPPLPIVSKLREAKERALYQIDRQVHLAFYQDLESDHPRQEDIDYEKVRTLLELRERVDGIPTWPFRIKSFAAAASVILLSAVPILIQLLVNLFLCGAFLCSG